jgi:hypothetical protein
LAPTGKITTEKLITVNAEEDIDQQRNERHDDEHPISLLKAHRVAQRVEQEQRVEPAAHGDQHPHIT